MSETLTASPTFALPERPQPNAGTVLLITFHFEDRSQIASQRVQALAKHLPALGWRVIVVTCGGGDTTSDGPVTVVRVPSRQGPRRRPATAAATPAGSGTGSGRLALAGKAVRRSLYRLKSEVLHYPDRFGNWWKRAAAAAVTACDTQDVDVIISTYGPASCHLAGHRVAKETGKPWVADYRDAWSHNAYYLYSPVRRWFDRRLERRTIATATHLVATNGQDATALAGLASRQVHRIPNAAATERISGTPQIPDRLRLVHAGELYEGRRDPSALFAGVSKFLANHPEAHGQVSAHFYGRVDPWAMQRAKQHQLDDVVEFHGLVPWETIMDVQRRAAVLVCIQSDGPEERQWLPAKLFEYMIMGRPILATGAHADATDALLADSATGRLCRDADTVAEFLGLLWSQWRAGNHDAWRRSANELEPWSHATMARRFHEVLTQARA